MKAKWEVTKYDIIVNVSCIVLFLVFASFLAFILTDCQPRRRVIICTDKWRHAMFWSFDGQFESRGESIYVSGVATTEGTTWFHVWDRAFSRSENFDRRLGDIVFVLDSSERANFRSNAIVAWPSEFTQGLINGLHLEHLRGNIDLEYFGMQYPITFEAIVNDWQQYSQIWDWSYPNRIDTNHLHWEAQQHGAAAFLDELEKLRAELAKQ